MSYWWCVYRANLKVGISMMLQYRFTIIVWAIWGFVGPLIALAVWSAAAAARGGTITASSGASYDQRDFAAYFLVYMIFSHFTMSWDSEEFAFRVRNGNLNAHLLKPLHPIHNDAAQNVAFKLTAGVMVLPAWILLFLLLKPSPPTVWWAPIEALPAVVLAGVLRFVWQYSLAAIAFWTTRVEAINQLYFMVDGFLAGRIAPVELMPGWLGLLALYSPFRAMGAFPVELSLGRVPAAQVLPGFALQLMWLVTGLVVLRLVWSGGVKQYSAVGA